MSKYCIQMHYFQNFYIPAADQEHPKEDPKKDGLQ